MSSLNTINSSSNKTTNADPSKYYDVIIVGGGPGGLSTARHLSGSDLKVLVLEKSPTVGKKICSGEISSKVLPGVEFGGAQDWKTVIVGTKKGKVSVAYDRPFLRTVGRFELESFLKSETNADIHFSEPVLSITKDFVQTTKGCYSYKFLVGADGSFSKVREYLKLPMKHIVGWAFHFLVDSPADEFRVYWLPDIFPRGYGYLMSKSRGQTMIGGAMAGSDAIHKDLAPKVKEWAANEFDLDIKKLSSEGMKGNADYRGWNFGNTYLVGDAAGLLNPLTTEGIYYAVKSGEGVAKHIIGKKEGDQIMRKMVNDHKWQAFIFNFATDPSLPLCRIIEWILSNPSSGVRKKIFDYVFWKFMDG